MTVWRRMTEEERMRNEERGRRQGSGKIGGVALATLVDHRRRVFLSHTSDQLQCGLK